MSRLARIWAAWAEPWRSWRARLFRWFTLTGTKQCPACGFVPDEALHPALGPPVCPRCGAPFGVPGR